MVRARHLGGFWPPCAGVTGAPWRQMLPPRRMDSHDGTGHDVSWRNESHMNFSNAMISVAGQRWLFQGPQQLLYWSSLTLHAQARCLMTCPGLRDLSHQVDGLHASWTDFQQVKLLGEGHRFSSPKAPSRSPAIARICLFSTGPTCRGRLLHAGGAPWDCKRKHCAEIGRKHTVVLHFSCLRLALGPACMCM